jgi:hypothetical protein
MKVEDLRVMLQHARDDDEVMIVTKLPYQTVGAHPMTKVKSATSGFDWESGKFMIWPESDLYPSNDELIEKFKVMEKQSQVLFIKNMELEKEIRRLKKNEPT